MARNGQFSGPWRREKRAELDMGTTVMSFGGWGVRKFLCKFTFNPFKAIFISSQTIHYTRINIKKG
jgi:hypothetical protein